MANRSPITVALLVTLVSAVAWAVLRLLLFMAMTQERELWGDFGGWVFPSIFVFLTWGALYHGIKYYQLMMEQRRLFSRWRQSNVSVRFS